MPDLVHVAIHQDTFYVGTLKGVGRIYQQTYVDTYSSVAHAMTGCYLSWKKMTGPVTF